MPFGASSPRHQKQGTSTLDEHGHEAASCASKAGCRAFIARQWFNALLSIACAVCFTVAKIKDPEPVPGVWLAAAITGALPAARLVVWLAEHLLRLDPFEMLLWYATPVLRHAVPCTWATVVMATLRRNPTDDELLQLVMLSCCWLLIGWSLARTLIHMGLQFLRHVLTLNHAPANQAKQRRALQILAYLYTCAKQGTGAPPAASILTMSGAKAQSSHPSLSDIFGDMPSGTGSSTSTGATRASTTPINEEQDTFTGIGVTVETSYAPSASPTFNSSAIPEAKPGRPQQRTPMVTAASAPTLHKRSGSGGATTSARAPAATTAAAVAAPGTSSLGRNDKSAALLAGAATAAAAAASAQTLSVDWLPHTQFSRRFKWAKRPKLAPVVADQAQLELLLGLLEDNDKRQKCMRSLYEYIRSMRHGKLVVSSVSLQKVLAPPDASLLVSQLGLFRRVLTRDEFAKAVVALQSRYNRSTGSTSTGHVTWTLRILVRLQRSLPTPTRCRGYSHAEHVAACFVSLVPSGGCISGGAAAHRLPPAHARGPHQHPGARHVRLRGPVLRVCTQRPAVCDLPRLCAHPAPLRRRGRGGDRERAVPRGQDHGAEDVAHGHPVQRARVHAQHQVRGFNAHRVLYCKRGRGVDVAGPCCCAGAPQACQDHH